MRDISSQTSMQSAYGNEKAKSCPGRRSTRCAPAILVWMSAQTAFPPLPPPPRLHSVVFTLFPPPHPTPRCFPCTRTTLTHVTLAHPRSHTCKHTHACTAHSALFDQLTPLALSHMHADTRQRRTASSSFSLPALFTRTHCKKYPFFPLLALRKTRHVCKRGLFLQCVQDLAVTLRAEGGLQCMSQWQPQKKITYGGNGIWKM